MAAMKHHLLSIFFAAMGVLMTPLMALAEDEEPIYDARLENYKAAVKVPEASAALSWLLLILLTIICLAVLFKNAKRTHMD